MCAISLRSANAAAPTLDLSMTGGFNPVTSTATAQVNRTNTDFGLGGLSYNLQFSESLNLTREYSDYGWMANDGIFDSSIPTDGSTGSFTNIRFDTVHSPAGSEFSPGSGTVESLNITLSNLTPRWIYFDIIAPSASNGSGTDLITGLGGSINIIPAGAHTLVIYIPEPTTMLLFSIGGLFALKKHRK
jgi:hypothetical protein